MFPLQQSLLPIPDPRRAQGKLYDLPLFSILAVMSGATSYWRIHQVRLNEAFSGRWRRTPAYRSLRYALQGLDCGQITTPFEAKLHGWIKRLAIGKAAMTVEQWLGLQLACDLHTFSEREIDGLDADVVEIDGHDQVRLE